jgi:hypothetical protein
LDDRFDDDREREGDQHRRHLGHAKPHEEPMEPDAVDEKHGDDHQPRPPRRDAELRARIPGEIGPQQRDREMADIDEPQQAPGQAQSQGEQPVEPARQQAGEERLLE